MRNREKTKEQMGKWDNLSAVWFEYRIFSVQCARVSVILEIRKLMLFIAIVFELFQLNCKLFEWQNIYGI